MPKSARNQLRVNQSWLTINVNDHDNLHDINLQYEFKKMRNRARSKRTIDAEINHKDMNVTQSI